MSTILDINPDSLPAGPCPAPRIAVARGTNGDFTVIASATNTRLELPAGDVPLLIVGLMNSDSLPQNPQPSHSREEAFLQGWRPRSICCATAEPASIRLHRAVLEVFRSPGQKLKRLLRRGWR